MVEKLVSHVNANHPAAFTPVGETTSRCNPNMVNTFLKNILEWGDAQFMKTRKPGVSSGGGTIDEAELAAALSSDPPDMEALQGSGGPDGNEWFVIGPVADNYREIWLSVRTFEARAKAKKTASNAQAQENERNAVELRHAATTPGRTPKKANPAGGSKFPGKDPLSPEDMDLSGLNEMIRLRTESVRAELGPEAAAKRLKLEEDKVAAQNKEAEARIQEAKAKQAVAEAAKIRAENDAAERRAARETQAKMMAAMMELIKSQQK